MPMTPKFDKLLRTSTSCAPFTLVVALKRMSAPGCTVMFPESIAVVLSVRVLPRKFAKFVVPPASTAPPVFVATALMSSSAAPCLKSVPLPLRPAEIVVVLLFSDRYASLIMVSPPVNSVW